MAHNFLKGPQEKMGKSRSLVELKKSDYIIRLFSGLSNHEKMDSYKWREEGYGIEPSVLKKIRLDKDSLAGRSKYRSFCISRWATSEWKQLQQQQKRQQGKKQEQSLTTASSYL